MSEELKPSDYDLAREAQLTTKDRWGNDIKHHPMSERLMRFLAIHDFEDWDDSFCWKVGGDGDNGETLMFQMDSFFELLDIQNTRKPETGWISVDKPPEEGGHYWIGEGHEQGEALYSKERKEWKSVDRPIRNAMGVQCLRVTLHPTHWQPLPTPPEELKDK